MSIHPVSLTQPDADRLRITWNDGLTQDFPLTDLQANCPCATCREKRNSGSDADGPPIKVGNMSLSIMTPEEAQPVRLKGVKPVGNYAYGITYNHGCGQGIFRFELLRDLGRLVTEEEASPTGSDAGESS